jgi:hypothetical protein
VIVKSERGEGEDEGCGEGESEGEIVREVMM